MELVTGLIDTANIVGVDDEDKTLGVVEVVPPEGADPVLATDVPHVHVKALVLDSLDVEADGWDGGHVLAELELIEDGRLAGGVETKHKAAGLTVLEPLLEDAEEIAHPKCHFCLVVINFGGCG